MPDFRMVLVALSPQADDLSAAALRTGRLMSPRKAAVRSRDQ
jgi:hypothetical protein